MCMKRAGFSLVEMMVAVAIFTFFVISGISAIYDGLSLFRQTVAQVNSINTVAFIMDSMSRQMVTGTFFSCDSGDTLVNCSDPNNPSDDIYFIDQYGRSVSYFVESDPDDPSRRWIVREIYDPEHDITITESLTSPNYVRIPEDGLRFLVANSGYGDGKQAIVFIKIGGEARFFTGFRDFDIETTVVPRRIDN